MYTHSNFKAAWWLKNPHFQTITAKFLRRNLYIETLTETIELPDGDFIDIAWTEVPKIETTQKIIVVLHGLEGSKDSHYAKGILTAIKHKGWVGLLMHFRSCSGRPNRLASSYHSGDIRDISFLSGLLEKRYRHASFGILGYSLGGNVLTNFLTRKINNTFKVAAIICAPLDISSCSDRINKGFSKVYQKYLVSMLKDKTRRKIADKIITSITTTDLKKIITIRDFDEHITAPINGFKNANDYYKKASGNQFIHKITQPCLFIHSTDDPFLCHENIIPQAPLPKNITFEVTNEGGHVGFISGKNPFKPIYWHEQKVIDFFAKNFIKKENNYHKSKEN